MAITISPLNTLIKDFQGILLDAAGVFWGGSAYGLLPGAKEAMEKLMLENKIVGILSNSAGIASGIQKALASHGLLQGKHFHFLLTSGEVLHQILVKKQLPFPSPKKSYYLFGEAHPTYPSHMDLFRDTLYKKVSTIEEADFLYPSIPHILGEDQTDPEVFRKDLQQLLTSPNKPPLVCSNPDHFAHEGSPPRLVVRQGSLAALYQEMGGTVFFVGKPHEVVYAAAMGLFGQHGIKEPAQVLMIGDTPETDIHGANTFGMASALVLQTGIAAERISQVGLQTFLLSLHKKDTPNYYIERLTL